MTTSSTRRVARRGAALAATSLVAIGIVVGVGAQTASAIPSTATTTSISCSGTFVYGGSITCTATVRRLGSFGSSADPTGTVTMGTITGRLPSSSCTLVGRGLGTKTSDCSMTVTPTDTGPMAPGAAYGGSGTHFPSVGATTITITSATLTITPDDDSRLYGASNPSFTVSYDGFKLGDDETDLLGTLECSTTADTASAVNDYPITCSGLTSPTTWVPNQVLPPYTYTPHYNIVWEEGTLSVDKAPLTITADNASRSYGEANPSFTVSYDSFVNNDDETDLGGTLNCTTSADETSPVGDYDIECDGLTSGNYEITFKDGTLSVGKHTLTITAADAERLIGHSNPSFHGIFDGFVGDDDETDLGGTMECTTPAHVDSPVGEYPIECSGMTSDNYEISFHNGTLRVLAEPGAEVPGGNAEVKPGEQVVIDVHDWMPDSTVIVNGCGIVDGEIAIDKDGNGQGTFTVPADVNAETCEITLTGSDATDNDAEVVISLALSPEIPLTGGESLPIGATALLLLLAGIGLVAAARRRAALRG